MTDIRVTYIIHSTFLIDYSGEEGVRILIDPFLEPLGDEKKVWLKKLDGIDLILITHSHFDHMGNTCEVLKNNPKAKYIAIYEIANHIQEKCGATGEGIGMNIGGTWTYSKEGLNIPLTLVHSTHSSDIGAPTGFIIRLPQFPVYHPGDTGVFTDMKLFGEMYGIKLALLPIGSHFTMGIDEAIVATKLIRPRYVIPMHYKTFPVIEADPKVFKRRVEEETETEVIVLNPGETHIFKL
jgi:L-ascorbate metabolism protein UlaG (beta-lactamase superfamily)